MQFIPADFESELKEVLTSDYFPKYASALKASKEEYEKELPASVSEQVVEKLLKFVSVKQTNHIVSKYEEELKDITEKIDDKVKERDSIQPPRLRKEKPKKEKRQRSPRTPRSDDSESLEDRLKGVLKELGKRTNGVKLSKDDYASFSEAQSQLDAVLRETFSEIMKLKQNLRKRFTNVQTRKSSTRKPRGRRTSTSE